MTPFTVYWMRKNVDEPIFIQFITMVSILMNQSTLNITYNKLSFLDPENKGESFIALMAGVEKYNFCTTHGNSYTKDVMKCVILMVELGMATEAIADNNKGFLEALEEVESMFNLNTYGQQKQEYSK